MIQQVNFGLCKKFLGLLNYPTGYEGLKALDYDPELLQTLPMNVASSYCGVGNLFILGPINAGEALLDVGCGAAVDTLFAAMIKGSSGKAVGIDLTREMPERAKKNLAISDLKNAK